MTSHVWTSNNQKFWSEFFDLYKSLPALWDINSQNYNDRDAKIASYKVLIPKLQEVEPNADRLTCRKKINTFRTNYRREVNRIEASKYIGGKPYKPKIWYYEKLSFLRDLEVRRKGRLSTEENALTMAQRKILALNAVKQKRKRRKINSKKEENKKETELESNVTTPEVETIKIEDFDFKIEDERESDQGSLESYTYKTEEEEYPSLSIGHSSTDYAEVSHSTRCHNELKLSSSEDTASHMSVEHLYYCKILGKSWAIQYSELAKDQKIFARKAIADVLFEGCMGNLRRNSFKLRTNNGKILAARSAEKKTEMYSNT